MIHPLSISLAQDYNSILKNWKWFREQLIKFYDLKTLPKTFSKNDGEIREFEQRDEDHPEYDFIAPEYNYTWRNQEIIIKEKDVTVEIDIDKASIGDHYRFEYQVDDDFDSYVKLIISSHRAELWFGDKVGRKEEWIKACEKLG